MTAVLWNVTSGYFSISRKSPLRRWLSRSGAPVVMLSALMTARTDDSSGFSAIVIAPLTSVNEPRTLLTIRWRATNPTVVWFGSRANVPGSGILVPSKVRVTVGVLILGPPEES